MEKLIRVVRFTVVGVQDAQTLLPMGLFIPQPLRELPRGENVTRVQDFLSGALYDQRSLGDPGRLAVFRRLKTP